jgi:hypothetical protein
MRGRRTLSWWFAPAQGSAGSLPEMTAELGDFYTRRRPPPTPHVLPSNREAGSGDHTASGSSDGGTAAAGDDNKAQGRFTQKRRSAGTDSDSDSADAPPAKKGRSTWGKSSFSGATVARNNWQPRRAAAPKATAAAKYRGECVLARLRFGTAMCTHTPPDLRTTAWANH